VPCALPLALPAKPEVAVCCSACISILGRRVACWYAVSSAISSDSIAGFASSRFRCRCLFTTRRTSSSALTALRCRHFIFCGRACYRVAPVSLRVCVVLRAFSLGALTALDIACCHFGLDRCPLFYDTWAAFSYCSTNRCRPSASVASADIAIRCFVRGGAAAPHTRPSRTLTFWWSGRRGGAGGGRRTHLRRWTWEEVFCTFVKVHCGLHALFPSQPLPVPLPVPQEPPAAGAWLPSTSLYTAFGDRGRRMYGVACAALCCFSRCAIANLCTPLVPRRS